MNIKKKYDNAIQQLQEEMNKSLEELGNKITNAERQNVDLLVTKLRKQRDSLSGLSNAIQKAKKGENVNKNVLENTAIQFEQIQKDFEYNLNLALTKQTLSRKAENRIGKIAKLQESKTRQNALNLVGQGGGKKKKGVKRVKGKKIKVVKGKKKVRKIHKGPRGGKYYISKGKKVYI